MPIIFVFIFPFVPFAHWVSLLFAGLVECNLLSVCNVRSSSHFSGQPRLLPVML